MSVGLILSSMTQFIAIQAEYHHDEAMIPKTSSLVTFTQLVGGVIGIAFVSLDFLLSFMHITNKHVIHTYRIAGMIFANSLVTQLNHFAPHLDSSIADHVRHSVTYIFTLPKDQQVPVIEAYSKAVGYTFLLPLPCGILASLSAM